SKHVTIARAPQHALVIPVAPIGDTALVPLRAHRRRTRFVALRVVDPECLASFCVNGGAYRRGSVHEKPSARHQRRRFEIIQQRRLPVAPPGRKFFIELLENGAPTGPDFTPAWEGAAPERVRGFPPPPHLQGAERLCRDLW